MATQWGGWSGHLRVGIDVWTDGYDTWTPSIRVFVAVYVQCDGSFNFSDNQTVTLSGSVGATYNFFNGLQANQVAHVGTYTIGGQVQSYGGGPNYYFEARLSGAYNGAAPAVGVNFWLPARPPRAPAPPSHGPNWSSITATSAYLDWGDTTDSGGSGLIEDHLQVSANSAFTALVFDATFGGSARSIAGLAPGTTYWSRARVRNGVGWSGWSATTTGKTGAFATGTPTISDLGPDAATLGWAAPAGGTPVSYEIQVATDSGFTNVVQQPYSPTWATSRVLGGLTPGTFYWARVRSGTSSGWGAWSPATSFETLSGAMVGVDGEWVDAVAYVGVGDSWKLAKVYKGSNGAWVL